MITTMCGSWRSEGKSIKALSHGKWFTIAKAQCKKFTDSGNEANARLMSAAPELLERCENALEQLEKMDFTCSANWNGSLKTNVALLLKNAIAKAKGGL